MKLFPYLTLGILLSLFSFTPRAYAMENQRESSVVVLPKTETVNHDYFAAGDTVHVSGIINGDAYVAGSTVIIDGVINGDLLTAGGTVTVTGQVKHDIRVIGGTVTIEGIVGGNITAGAGTLLIPATAKISGSLVAGSGTLDVLSAIGKGMTVGAGTLTVNGKIGGDMHAGVSSMALNENASVQGNLTYWSEQPMTFLPGATVAGTLLYHELPKSEKKPAVIAQNTVKTFTQMLAFVTAISVFLIFAVTFGLGVLIRAVLPEFTKHTVFYLRKNPLPAFGAGFIAAMITSIVLLTFVGSVIGIPLALIGIAGVCVLYVIGHCMAAYYVGNILSGGDKTRLHPALQLCIGMLVLGALILIPIFGWLTRCTIVIMGIGAVISETYSVYKALRSKKLI